MIPQEITYNNIRPKGFYTKFKEWPIQPLSSNMYWSPQQILRFQFQIRDGVMDPYRSHMVMTVSSPSKQQMPVGGLQVDSSAQSFIAQLVLTSKNIEIQRIPEYDTFACYLTDMGMSEDICQNRQTQGLGHQNYQVTPSSNRAQYGSSAVWIQKNGLNQYVTIQHLTDGSAFSPTKSPCPMGPIGSFRQQLAVDPQSFRQTYNTPSHLTSTNYLCYKNSIGQFAVTPTDILAGQTRFINVRAQYDPKTTLRHFVDSPNSIKTVAPLLKDKPINWTTKGPIPPGQSYDIAWAETVWTNVESNFTSKNLRNVPNIASIFGYDRPYSSKYGVGAFQPLVSPTIPQCRFGYGAILPKPVPVTQRKFQFPLLSSIIGVLIPPDQFKLLPTECLNGLMIQLTLSQFAMFSTGLSDIHQFDVVGMTNPLKRAYTVSKVYYNVHIYEWPQQQIQQYLSQSITRQIALTSASWTLTSLFQIPNGQYVRNNYPVNISVESLCQIVCVFLSNQYMKYPFVRKQFRLSNNISKFQIKFKTDYHPPQPILGNGGNPQQIDGSGTNAEFMQLLLTSNDYLFTTNVPQPRINKYNFAINGRCYDPSKTKPLYDPAMYENQAYQWTQNSVNADTAMGQSFFHQNRYIGKAAYVYSFQPFGHSQTQMIGIDTRDSRPFDVIFDTHSSGYFPSDETLYIFTRTNVVNVYSSNGIKVIGR